MTRPGWDMPIVSISSCRSNAYYSVEVMQEQALELGRATRAAIEKSGRRALLLASNSLSHRHFTEEPEVPEDMTHEHIYHHGQYLLDMRMIDLMRTGRTQEMIDLMPEFIDQSASEADSGSLTWMMGAMGFPAYPGEIYGYGTIIGTGNAVVGWYPDRAAS
jgi:2-aminophenol/2-amino-5-chlorophenol 1,6-dioxygenase beta subunit